MSTRIHNFLGDTLLRTIVKLVVLSFVVGVVLSALNLSVLDLFDELIYFVRRLWNMGFEAIARSGQYLLLGAAVVVPAFLIVRLTRYRR